jgi:hypothetical protein
MAKVNGKNISPDYMDQLKVGVCNIYIYTYNFLLFWVLSATITIQIYRQTFNSPIISVSCSRFPIGSSFKKFLIPIHHAVA